MRLLHFADLHIGVESYSRPDPETGLPSRVVDVLRALDQLVDFAIQEGVDLILFCGDAYKSREPSQTHQREFAKRLRRLVDAGIPIFLLVGNHDLPNAISRATALEIFETLGVPRVYVSARPGTQVIETRSGPVQIVALPWPNRSWLLSREEYRGLTVEQVERLIEERLASTIRQEVNRLDPDLPAILCAHVALDASQVKSGTERWMTVGREPRLIKSTLLPEAFDYVALGHHHVRQVLGLGPPVVYCGSLQRVDFAEAEDAKGFYTVELDPRCPRGQRVRGEPLFHEVIARRFLTLTITPHGDDPTPEVLARIRRTPIADAVVRLFLRLTAQQNALLREWEVRQALAEAHYVASIQRDVIRREEQVSRLPPDVVPESLSPLEALKLYLESKGYSSERRDLLLGYAQRLMARKES